MIKFILSLGLFVLIFSVVWITAVVNGFEPLHTNSEAFRSFSDILYCGGDTLSFSYGAYIPNSRPNTGGGRAMTALCTAADGTQREVSDAKTAIDIGVFLLLMVGGLAIIWGGIRLWIRMPIKAPEPQIVEP